MLRTVGAGSAAARSTATAHVASDTLTPLAYTAKDQGGSGGAPRAPPGSIRCGADAAQRAESFVGLRGQADADLVRAAAIVARRLLYPHDHPAQRHRRPAR